MRLRSATLLPALAVVHTMVWGVGLSAFPFAYSPRWAMAQYLSTFALVVVSTNLMLATRARPLERAFGGLDKLFASHRMDGIAAASIILAHVAIVPISVPILPGRAVGITALLLIEGSVILAITPRAPWRRLLAMPYQIWKAGHGFMGVIVVVAIAHSLLVPTMVRYMPVVRMWVYGVAALGTLAYVYRETAFRIVARRHRYRVTEARHVGDAVLEVHLEAVRAPIAQRAGQFAFVAFNGGPTRERHPFTISAAPSGGPLRFSIKASGDFTRALQTNLSAGSSASIEGPYGMFDFRAGRPRQLWLAGGIGITPFLAFLPTVEADREVTLVWSVRTADQAVYRDEIERSIADKPGVTLCVWPSATKGHLDVATLELAAPRELSVYLCGPVVMREAYLGQLASLGVSRADIHYEEFTLR